MTDGFRLFRKNNRNASTKRKTQHQRTTLRSPYAADAVDILYKTVHT